MHERIFVIGIFVFGFSLLLITTIPDNYVDCKKIPDTLLNQRCEFDMMVTPYIKYGGLITGSSLIMIGFFIPIDPIKQQNLREEKQ